MTKSLFKGAVLAALVAGATGCASNGGSLDEVRAMAQEAKRTAQSAQSTAQSAKQSADRAMKASQDSKKCCEANSKRIERMFEKSQSK